MKKKRKAGRRPLPPGKRKIRKDIFLDQDIIAWAEHSAALLAMTAGAFINATLRDIKDGKQGTHNA
jgi:hypothetical protein